MSKFAAQERIESLRRSIDGARDLERLEQLYQQANDGQSNIQALRFQADICFGRLKKVLPDLKAVEHSGETQQTVFVKF
jgi:hypothetical protein